jgi:acyl-CoA thioesterase I
VITIVALGDSTTAGTPGFQSPIEAPPHGSGDVESQYAYWLIKAQPDWDVRNRGVNGERSDQIRARFDRDVVSVQPALVVIVAGVNDIYQGRTAESVERQLQEMYDAARAARIVVIAGTILPFNTATADQNARMRVVNAWIEDYAAQHADILSCDTRAAVAAPDEPDCLASTPDGLHPSVEGYRSMARALEAAIRTALTRRQPLR